MAKKVLIHGSLGWLGRMTIDYLEKNFQNLDVYLVSSKKANLSSKKNKYMFINYNEFNELKNCNIDYLFYYGFLTQEKIGLQNDEIYIDTTDNIIESYTKFMSHNYVSRSLLSSSGAVYWRNTEKENLYTMQKLKQEHEFENINNRLGTEYLIARIFGIVGNQYSFEKNYAFTSFINSGVNGKNIHVKSKQKVLRSYLYFNDLIDYFFESNFSSEIIDTWNETLDLFDLATDISEIFNVDVEIDESYFISKSVDSYISKNENFKMNFDTLIDKNLLKEIIFSKFIF